MTMNNKVNNLSASLNTNKRNPRKKLGRLFDPDLLSGIYLACSFRISGILSQANDRNTALRSIFLFGLVGLLLGCNPKETTQPVSQDLVDAVFASGFVTTDHEYLVTANAEGFLLTALVEEGEAVKKGDQLFVISSNVQTEQLQNALANYEYAKSRLEPGSPEIQQSRLKLEQSRLQLDTDKKNYERYHQLVKTGAVAQVEFDQVKVQYENAKRNVAIALQSHEDLLANLQLNLENATTQLVVEREKNGDYVLTAAIDGMVISVFEQEGVLVRRGSPIAKIGGGAHLVRLFVAEEDINLLETGQVTYVSLNTDQTKPYQAEISRIFPAFDEQEQSFVAEARFLNRPAKLFPNTQLQANIVIAEKKDVITVPAAFLLKGDSVLLADKRKVAVEVGIRNSDWVEVVQGLSTDQILLLPQPKAL